MDFLTADQSRVPGLEPGERSRIREGFPNLKCMMRAISETLSSWQDDLSAALSGFCILEETEARYFV